MSPAVTDPKTDPVSNPGTHPVNAAARSAPTATVESIFGHKPVIEATLVAHLDAFADVGGTRAPKRLNDAMRYALLAGGKRLRPVLVLESAKAVDPALTDDERLRRCRAPLVAVECVHTYSLVHDDLPSLDDDDLRRGRQTLHVAYDEATAILAGDALLTDAFAVLSTAPENPARMVRELAFAAGSAGMVGGQLDDMDGEGAPLDEQTLRAIHHRKTGRLFGAACAMGALAAHANDDVTDALRAFGERLGLAFQIADDVLDVIGDEAARGKRSGGDEEVDKSTYVKLRGLEGARALAREVAEDAILLLAPLGEGGERLRALARYAAARAV